MAVTIDVAGLIAALRLSDSPEELAEATRILAYATEAVTKHVETAPNAVHNEAAVRLASYVYDQPTAARGDGYANALRNSGAARMLLPYRVHRAGYADSMESAQQAVGTADNPVTGLSLAGQVLTVTFADGSTDMLTFKGGQAPGGVDQTARDAAATAQNEINTHEATPHNRDATARAAGTTNAQNLAGHEASPHNRDATARSEAATNTAKLASHIAAHPTSGPSAADVAGLIASHRGDADAHHTPSEDSGLTFETNVGLGVFKSGNEVRHSFTPNALLEAGSFGSGDHAVITDGSNGGAPRRVTRAILAQGMQTAGLASTAALASTQAAVANAFVGATISGTTLTLARQSGLNPRTVVLPTSGMAVADGVIVSATVDVAQERVTVTTSNGETVQWDLTGILDVIRALIAAHIDAGARQGAANAQNAANAAAASASAVNDALALHVANNDAHQLPALRGRVTVLEAAITPGGGPTVLYEAAAAAIGGATALIAGNIVCPETGTLEVYCRQVTGNRKGSVAYARLPAADVRASISPLAVDYNNDNVNVRIIPHGANRGISLAVQATTFYMMLNAQSAGTYYVKITHIA